MRPDLSHGRTLLSRAHLPESRLIGFNFPQPGGKDVVVRYGAPVDTPSIEDSEDLAPVDSV